MMIYLSAITLGFFVTFLAKNFTIVQGACATRSKRNSMMYLPTIYTFCSTATPKKGPPVPFTLSTRSAPCLADYFNWKLIHKSLKFNLLFNPDHRPNIDLVCTTTLSFKIAKWSSLSSP